MIMAPAPSDSLDWEGQTVLDRGGEKIGKIEEIFLVEETGRPEWALVKIGRIKSRTTLVPLTRARAVEKGVAVHVSKDAVSDAPEVKSDSELGEQQVTELYRHYGIDVPAAPGPAEHSNGASGAVQTSDHAPAQATAETVSGTADLRHEPIGDLLKQVKEEGSTLVGQELKLVKAEMTDKVKDVGIGAGMFGGAGYVAHLASLALMLTIIFALAEAMPAWLAALIVTVLYGAVAAVLALKAKKKIQEAGPPIPEQTVESVKQTIETVKEEARWGLGQTR
jgi:hypothetical protein